MKKQASLESEVLKMLIALACIIVLIILGVKIYGVFQNKSALEQATAALSEIVSKAEGLSEANPSADYLLVNPKLWTIIYYEEDMPESCGNKECLCICKIAREFSKSNLKNACQTNGVCKNVAKDISMDFFDVGTNKINFYYPPKLPVTIYLAQKDNVVSISLVKPVSGQISTTSSFDKFLEYKSSFMGKEQTIEEQFIYLVQMHEHSGSWTAGQNEEIAKNVREYFKDYSMITVFVYSQSTNTPAWIRIYAGIEGKIKDGINFNDEQGILAQQYSFKNPETDGNIILRIKWRDKQTTEEYSE